VFRAKFFTIFAIFLRVYHGLHIVVFRHDTVDTTRYGR